MARYYIDLTRIQLVPEWPFNRPREVVPTLSTWWDRQVARTMERFPRLFNKKVAAVILRRLQESIARRKGLPE